MEEGIMANYRAIVHYHFKKGMEEQAIKFIEKELVKKAQKLGCHFIELLQNEKDHSKFIGIGTWNDIEDARRFQSLWEEKEKELMHFCVNEPEREFFTIRASFQEKTRKAA